MIYQIVVSIIGERTAATRMSGFVDSHDKACASTGITAADWNIGEIRASGAGASRSKLV